MTTKPMCCIFFMAMLIHTESNNLFSRNIANENLDLKTNDSAKAHEEKKSINLRSNNDQLKRKL